MHILCEDVDAFCMVNGSQRNTVRGKGRYGDTNSVLLTCRLLGLKTSSNRKSNGTEMYIVLSSLKLLKRYLKMEESWIQKPNNVTYKFAR